MDGSDPLRTAASLLGASGVALGAFGAHALKSRLAAKPGADTNWRTAVTYQLLHAVALLSVSNSPGSGHPQHDGPTRGMMSGGRLIFLGTALFSGSIYLLTLDIGPKTLLGPTTPVGGLMMIGGWVLIGLGRP